MKRSVNFTGRKPMKASHVLSIANWLGMSEAEQHVVFGGAPLFVNLNGEETTPATITGGTLRYSIGGREYRATYKSADIHAVECDGDAWYEINDTALTID